MAGISNKLPRPALSFESKSRLCVVMMVRNAATHDARVRKEAATLSRAGYDVTVVGVHTGRVLEEEYTDGVRYLRLPKAPTLYQERRALFTSPQQDRRAKYLDADAQLRERLARERARWEASRERLVAMIRQPLIGPPVSARHSSLLWSRTVLVGRRTLVKLRRARRYARRYQLRVARSRFILWHRTIQIVRRLHRWRYRLGGRPRTLRWGLEKRLIARSNPVEYHWSWIRTVGPTLRSLEPDVLHAHDLNTVAAAIAYRLRRRVNIVYDAHELELERNVVRTRVERHVAAFFERLIVRLARAVITVSPQIASELQKTYRKREVFAVLNTPPSSVMDVAVESVRTRLPVNGARLVVYTGAAHASRNLHSVVKALPLLDDEVHFVVLGPRQCEHDRALRGLAAELGVASRVHLLPPVRSHEVPMAVSEADVLISPASPVCRSYELALPNKLFDAVFAGVHIAVSRLPAMREFVAEHGLGTSFDERDPASIAGAIRHLLSGEALPLDPLTLIKLRERYSWESQEQTLLDIYAGLRPVGRKARS